MENQTENKSAVDLMNLGRVAGGGALGGAVGFGLAKLVTPSGQQSDAGLAAAQGLWFMCVALGIGGGVIGMMLSSSGRRPNSTMLLLGAVGVLGGGFFSGYLAQTLYSALLDTEALNRCFNQYQQSFDDSALNWCYANTVRLPRVMGWAVAGAVIGVGIGLFFRSLRHGQNGAVGGIIGGLVGGLLFDSVPAITGISSLSASQLIAVAIIGGLIGGLTSLISAARVTAWLDVVSGELRGRRFMLVEQTSRIGSIRSLEIPLIGDGTVADVHATITVSDSAVRIEPVGPNTVMVEGRAGAAALRDGSEITIGRTVLRAGLRRGPATGAPSTDGRDPVTVARAAVPDARTGVVPAPQSGPARQRPTISTRPKP